MEKPRRMDDPIAETEIQFIAASGESFTSTLRVYRPRQDDRGMWSCAVSMDDLLREDELHFGEDSLQALCLALSFARSRLQDFVVHGGRVLIPGTEDDFSIDACFGTSNI
jgi:hypothetical protein